MPGRLASLVERGARLLEQADPEAPAPNTVGVGLFLISSQPVEGNFASGDESVLLTTTGGQQEKFRGTLVVSRIRYPAKPELMSIILGPDQTRYRITGLNSDSASWTLTLTAPNGRK